ncbi:MAG: hypothetical protein ACJ8C8_16240 [Microvirga sp.]
MDANLEKQTGNTHIKPMNAHAESAHDRWRTLPLEGAYELFYCDEAGHTSRRRLFARELKVGPGKTLLGGIDQATEAYRGFRADRIEYLMDGETGETVRRNVLDWLLKRAARQEKARRAEAKRAA